MGRDVEQWNELNMSGDYRGFRGGSYDDTVGILDSSSWSAVLPTDEFAEVGFRVAASVPEPGSVTLLVAGALGFIGAALHRRRHGVKH